MKHIFWSLFLLIACLNPAFSQDKLPIPDEFFGFHPGSDGNLFTYEEMMSYLEELDQASDRMEIREIGTSPEGKKMYLVFISAKENLNRLDSLKEINRQLALNPEIDETRREEYISGSPVFVMATLSMHSTEVGPTQAFPLIAAELCSTRDEKKLKWLKNTVFMVVPNHNPDGMDKVVDYYNKTKNTKYEGSSLPGVYHKYVGHDNNRDFVTLSQSDTRAIASVYNVEWFPQVFVEKHQMGTTDTRYFVPPNHDPIAENIDEGIWTWMGIFGANMINDMTAEGQAGVSKNYLFDNYWPGSTETCIWKNVIGFLTEAASAKVATPVYVEPTELNTIGKGLGEYRKSVNMPLPWKGGWWHLSDIVDYEITSTWSVLNTAVSHREEILRYRNDLCKKQVQTGSSEAPYYYVLPLEQHDQSELCHVVNLMREHGVKVYELEKEKEAGNLLLKKGDIIIPMAQPYRAFIKEVMEKQEYPVRRYMPEGEIIEPYDITTWSLPLHNGLNSWELNEKPSGINEALKEIKSSYKIHHKDTRGKYLLFPVSNNESYKAAFNAMETGFPVGRTNRELVVNGTKLSAGSFVVELKENEVENKQFVDKWDVQPLMTDQKPETKTFELPSVGLVETYFHDMDAGWTRFVLDSYHIPFKIIRPGEVQKTDLSEFDILIFPDENKSVLMEGKVKRGESYYVTSYAPEFTGGIEKEGLAKLMKWVNGGGKIVSWGGSTALFEGPLNFEPSKNKKEEFQLPFKDISESLQKKGLYCPGSLVRVNLADNHPLTLGMPDETAVFYRGKPVFTTSVPVFDTDRRVIGTIPEDNILVSGYARKEESLGNRPVMLWLKKGKGQLVLMGFNPQFRASTHATYKLLFNALLLEDNDSDKI